MRLLLKKDEKTLKMLQDIELVDCICRDSADTQYIVDQQKEGKQGRDYSIKQFSIQLHPSTFNSEKIFSVELRIELFYTIIHTLFPWFSDLLSPCLVTFAMFFNLVYFKGLA